MDNLLDITLLVLGVLTTMSALLYVLATIDPQTDSAPVARTVSSPAPTELSTAA